MTLAKSLIPALSREPVFPASVHPQGPASDQQCLLGEGIKESMALLHLPENVDNNSYLAELY